MSSLKARAVCPISSELLTFTRRDRSLSFSTSITQRESSSKGRVIIFPSRKANKRATATPIRMKEIVENKLPWMIARLF